jgi:hypothetical protein
MEWREFEKVAAAHHLTLPAGFYAGPVVQLEAIDFADSRVSPRLLWMEGRGWNWKAVAEGSPEPRNPGEDNPLRWPRQYLQKLTLGVRGRRGPRSDFRLERAALFAWLNGTSRLPSRPEWLVNRNARWQKPLSFALIAETWAALTRDWASSGVPLIERDAATMTERPVAVPATLGWLPQAVIAWDEWLGLSTEGDEDLDESTVRQQVTEVMRPW